MMGDTIQYDKLKYEAEGSLKCQIVVCLLNVSGLAPRQ